MKLIGEFRIEVTQIVIRKNDLLNKRIIDTFERTMFFSEIEDVGIYSYRVENNYVKCAVIIKRSGEWIKIKDDYNEVNDAVTNWYKQNEKSETVSAN